MWKDYSTDSEWICVEAYVKLNTPGEEGTAGSADGIEKFWIDDVEQGAGTGTNHNLRGSYTQYGINQVVFDNWWNFGSEGDNTTYRDNIVIATERIGCEVTFTTTSTGVIAY
jgi:hypothetical protein